jgi:hypothetical protein
VIDSRQWFGRPPGDWCSAELLLAHGAAIVAEKRAKVFSQLGYTVSAGMHLHPMPESNSCGWCTHLLQNFWLNDGAAECFHSRKDLGPYCTESAKYSEYELVERA